MTIYHKPGELNLYEARHRRGEFTPGRRPVFYVTGRLHPRDPRWIYTVPVNYTRIELCAPNRQPHLIPRNEYALTTHAKNGSYFQGVISRLDLVWRLPDPHCRRKLIEALCILWFTSEVLKLERILVREAHLLDSALFEEKT